jgi:hypothetical protein
MIEAKHIKKLLSEHPKKSIINVLMHGLIKGHVLTITDLDYTLILKDAPIENGFVFLPDYIKTGNLEASLAEGITEDDFPRPLHLPEGVKIPVDIFSDIEKFYHYTNDNYYTRTALTGINYDFSLGKIRATNGHILHYREIAPGNIGCNFLVPSRFAKILLYISDTFTIETIELIETDAQYLRLVFAGNTIIIKCMEGPYPDYLKKLPEMDKKKIRPMTAAQKSTLLAALDTMIPYCKADNDDMHFFDGNLITYNADTEKYFHTKIASPFSINPIDFNGKYLKTVLSDSGDVDCEIYSHSRLGATLLFFPGNMYAIMPCAIKEDLDLVDALAKSTFIAIPEKAVKAKKEKRVTVDGLLKIIERNKEKTGEEILSLISGASAKKAPEPAPRSFEDDYLELIGD